MANRFNALKLLNIVIFYVIVSCVHCAIYNNRLVIRRNGGSGLTGSHFGYSVAIQRGTPSRLIIGAPKQGAKRVGSVFACSALNEGESKDCTQYTLGQKNIENINNPLRNDIMFGSSLDGGTDVNSDILIGASKLSQQEEDNNYAIGGVFKLSDVERGNYKKYPKNDDTYFISSQGNVQYFSGFAQFGFSVHYVNATTNIYGTPGYYHWRGDAFVSMIAEVSGVPAARIARPRIKRATQEIANGLFKVNNPEDQSSLTGYAVTSGKFFGYTSYVVGAPTARTSGGHMKGNVFFFNEQLKKDNIEFDGAGREMGEHFGASLVAADINGDGHDDLLVGAPNAHKKGEFNNGKVYVFISDGSRRLTHHQTLTGKIGTRFGTSMSNLGQITLDSHESIAIGGPFGDHGGVRVYVWVGGKLTLDSTITMKEFPSLGYSLSRGVDVDDNSVADFAAGAVQSDAVVILKAKTVFYFSSVINYSELKADSNENEFTVDICIDINTNSSSLEPVETSIGYTFDDRIKFTPRTETKILRNSQTCQRFNLVLHQNVQRYDPLNIVMKLKEKECDDCPVRSPTYPDEIRHKIPFKNNCKGEICVPDIKIETSVPNKLTVGEQNDHQMTVNIINNGDTAFICDIDIITKDPVNISPLQNKKCEGTSCRFNYITNTIQQEYSLDFSRWSSFKSNLDLEVTTKCINFSKSFSTRIRLIYVAKLVVEGPRLTKQYDSVNGSTYDIESGAIFHISNEGPSDLERASFIINIPRDSHEEQIVDIYKPLDNDNCQPVDGLFDKRMTDFETQNSFGDVTAAGFGKSANAENTISCDGAQVQCFSIRCEVKALGKGKMHKIHIPIRLNITTILKNYRSTFSIQSTISRDGGNDVIIAELDVVDKQTLVEGVNVWIIIGTILGALVLLALIIGGLYKFGFFNRPERELIKEAEEIEGTMEDVEMRQPVMDNAENFDNVDSDVPSNSAQPPSEDRANSLYAKAS